MKPAEEDVMAEAIYTQWIKEGIGGRKTTAELLRLAIRAAVAYERKRAADIAGAESSCEGIAQRIAAAIRRGE